MKVFEIETPAVIIDVDAMGRNSDKMMSAIRASKAMLRPHFKSHKCTEIVKLQMQSGAKGVTCAKLSEAEVLVKSGATSDVLIANQIVERSKLDRLAALAKTCKMTVCVDDASNVKDLECAMAKADSSIGVLIEYEIGMQRCGVLNEEDFYALWQVINECPHLIFRGIQAYAGHNSHEVDSKKRLAVTEANNVRLRSLIAYLKARGVHCEIVSGASTGTAMMKMNEGIYNEIQAGSYLFLDDCYNKLGLDLENALYVLTTVVSVKDNLAVVDAGVKTVGVDQGLPTFKDIDCSEIVASEEHFQLHNPSVNLQLGQKVMLVPGHCCSTNNLHDKIYAVQGDNVVAVWNVDGRGIGR